MPEKNRNLFGHQSIKQPTTPPPVERDRFHQMMDMVRGDQAMEEEPTKQDANVMAPADLEQLIYLGAIEDAKEINGFHFNMRTLTGKETNDVLISVSFLNDSTKFSIIMVAVLARAIVSINGKRLEMLYTGKDFDDLTKEQRCIKVVEGWQQPLIDELYSFYSGLLERSRKVIKPEDIKK